MFKLILGLGNKDIETAKKLALIYSKIGVDIIDSSIEVYGEIKKILQNSDTPKGNIKLGVSVALFGDVHSQKAKINKNCKQCGKCAQVCNSNAISKAENIYRIDYKKCVGCTACKKKCKNNAIDIYKLNSFKDDINYITDNNLNPDFLELHLSIKKKKEIFNSFEYVLNRYKGNISICLSRKYFGTEKVKKTILKLKEIFDKKCTGYDFILQADGTSINNANDEYSSNLEALAFYKELSELGFNVIVCGGLNEKAVELCKLFNLKPYALAFGSYARKIADNEDNVRQLINSVKEFYK